MSYIVVFTDKGDQVGRRFEVPTVYQGNMVWRNMVGRYDEPLGWLGRTLRDARFIEQGLDPERLSEKVMRLVAEASAREADPS